MKIALLSYEYPTETGFGGIGTYTWHQARALSKLGHEVHVLAGATSATGLRRDDHDGVFVYRFRDNPLWLKLFALDRRKPWWTRNRLENAFSMYRGFLQLLEQQCYDVVEMPECGAEGLFINHLLRLPTIVRFHSPAKLIMPFYDVRKSDYRLCSTVEQIGLRAAAAYTSSSHFLADEVHTRMGIKRHIRVVPNGIDLQLFDSSDQVNARDPFGIPKGKPMILFAGRMEKRKGIHLCKEIAAGILKRRDAALVFAGQDDRNFLKQDLLPSLRGMALRGSVHYLGRLDFKAVRSCLRQTDIFLLPSMWESCPYSCLEAMAAGRAIVSSDAGGLPELIQDGVNGLTAPSGDPGAFVLCLERLIDDPSLRDRLGRAARISAETFHSDVHVARRSLDYYNEVAGKTATVHQA